MNFLFVCTGNTCRSPMAEALMRAAVAGRHAARSAGLSAFPGLPMAYGSREALREIGIDADGTSSTLDAEAVRWADRILAMEAWQAEEILGRFPAAAGKTTTLGRWAGAADEEIADPIGAGLEIYRKTRDDIVRLVRLGIERESTRGEDR